MVLLPLLGFRLLLNPKKGRKNKHHHYLAAVVLLRKKPRKHGWLNVVLPLPKLLFVWRVLLLLFKNCLLLPLPWFAAWFALARLQRVFLNTAYSQFGVFRLCTRCVPPCLLVLKQARPLHSVNVHNTFNTHRRPYSFLPFRPPLLLLPFTPVRQVWQPVQLP